MQVETNGAVLRVGWTAIALLIMVGITYILMTA
jgi:hypothetical protein